MSQSQQILRTIEEAANRHGVNPDTLKIIARIESSLNPNAVGPQTRYGRAQGLFQFIPDTARRYGLKNPLDVAESADAAARYIKDLGRQYNNNLPVMLAQYNGGNAGARNAQQGKLFEETAGYLDKYNRYARELGLKSRIDTSVYSVIPRPGNQPSPRARTTTRSFVGEQTSAPVVPTAEQTRSALSQRTQEQDFQDEQRTFGESVANFGAAAAAGFAASNLTIQAVLDFKQVSDGPVDPEWTAEASTENLIKMLEEREVDRDQWDYVLQGSESREGFESRLQRVEQMRANQEEMSRSAGGAIVGALAGGILDPVFWVSGVAGAIAAPAKAARSVQLALGAAAGATVDGAVSAGLGETVDPAYGTLDTVINAAAGALGGAIGAYARGRRLNSEGEPIEDLPDPEDFPPREPEQEEPEAPRPPLREPEVDQSEEPPLDLPPLRPEDDLPQPPEQLPPGAEGDVDAPLPPQEPPKPPRTDEWDEEWDTPEFTDGYLRGDIDGESVEPTLLLPPNLSPKGMVEYIKRFGSEREKRVVSLIEKNSQKLDLILVNVNGYRAEAPRANPGVLQRRSAAIKEQIDDIPATARPEDGRTAGAWAYLAERDAKRTRLIGVQAHRLRESQNRKGITAENFMHETLHSMTTFVTARMGNPSFRAAAPASLVKAYDDLNAAFQQWKKVSQTQYDAEFMYGMKDIHEFIAETASAPFERVIRRMADHSTNRASLNALQKLLGGIRRLASKILGTSRNDDAVEKVLDTYYGTVVRFVEESNSYRATFIKEAQITPTNATKVDAPMLNIAADDMALRGAGRQIGQAPELEDLVKVAGNGVTFGKGYGGFALENILQNPKMPPAVRALGAKLLGSTAGYRNGGVVGRNAWDDTVSLRTSRKAQYIKGHHVNFEKWFIEQRKRGQYDFTPWGRERALKDFSEAVYEHVQKIKTSEDPLVLAAAAANQAWFLNWAKLINNPGADEGRTIRGLTMREVDDVDEVTGEVKIDPATGKPVKKVVGQVPEDPDYMPFQLSTQKLNELTARYGREEVEKLFEEAFYSGNPKLREVFDEGGKNYGKMFSRWYLKQVLDSRVNRKFDYLHSLETSASGDELLESMVNGGVAREDAEQIIKRLEESNAGEQAFNSQLRKRSHYDRLYQKQMPDGSFVRVHDFVEKDIARLADLYNSRMSGAVALAKNFEGVHSYSDFSRLFFRATEREFGNGQMTDAQVAEARAALETAMNHILGRPLDEVTNVKQGLSVLRNYNVATKLGGAVVYQIIEMAQLIGSIGMRNVLKALPELRGSWLRSKQTGRVANEELDAYEDFMGGSGTEMLEYMDLRSGDEWSQLNGFGKGAQRADAIDFGSRKAASGVLKYTGMTGAMVIEKRIALIAITRHFQNVALGKDTMKYSKARLEWMGMDDAAFAQVKAAMVKYTKTGARGRQQVDIRKWAEQDPDSFAKWRVALQRESRRVIQENDLGSHIPAMDNGYFKSFAQFRTFVLQAWNKSTLFGVNHMDAQLATSLAYAIFFAMGAQTYRAYLKASTMSEEDAKAHLDKALSLAPGSVLFQSIASISQASIAPQLFDTISPFGNLFDGYRTTTDSSSIFANPTFDVLDRITGTAKQAAYTMTGQDTIDQRDFKQIQGLVPFQNALPMSIFFGEMSKLLPAQSKADLLFNPEEE